MHLQHRAESRRRFLLAGLAAAALAACSRQPKAVAVPPGSAVLADPALRSDPIHANAAGYAAFARGLAGTAHDVGLLTLKPVR